MNGPVVDIWDGPPALIAGRVLDIERENIPYWLSETMATLNRIRAVIYSAISPHDGPRPQPINHINIFVFALFHLLIIFITMTMIAGNNMEVQTTQPTAHLT